MQAEVTIVSIPDRDYLVLQVFTSAFYSLFNFVSIPDRDYLVLQVFTSAFYSLFNFVSIPDRDYLVLQGQSVVYRSIDWKSCLVTSYKKKPQPGQV